MVRAWTQIALGDDVGQGGDVHTKSLTKSLRRSSFVRCLKSFR